MADQNHMTNDRILSKLFFRLLPIQILLAAMSSFNGIVSSLFAGNFLGEEAMSAIGLYTPVNLLLGAISTMLVGGSQILCGKYMGKNQLEKTQDIFSLDISISTLLSVAISVVLVLMAMTNMTTVLAGDPGVRAALNQYFIGMAVGILPLILGAQLAAFLSLELQTKRTMTASIIYILANIVLNFLFVGVLNLQALGLALASSLGCWIFLLIQAQYYFTGKALLKFRKGGATGSDAADIIKIGFPAAVTQGYIAIRLFVVNGLLTKYTGPAGIAAYTAANSLTGIGWAVPMGMAAVSRMLMSVAVGEEDRQSVKDVMKHALTKCEVILFVFMAFCILIAVPLTRLYYRDPSQPIYQMTRMGFRTIPLAFPLGHICLHVNAYAQTIGKQLLTHLESAMDGVIAVVFFSVLLVPKFGINGLYAALYLNGWATVFLPVIYSWIVNRHFPKNMDELLMLPKDFGAPDDARLDLSVRSMEEVVHISRQVQDFCRNRGIDEKRAYLSALFLEEMAGNVVDHGFTKDKKSHSVDVRVVHKDDNIILRIKDDCVRFNPEERSKIVDPEDPEKNIGIRMVYNIAKDITYQNMLGLNVLTIRI